MQEVGQLKAISLWQPWASLVSIGAKRFETRSWAPPKALLHQRIAIHAAKAANALTMRGVSHEAREAMSDAFARSNFTSAEFNVGLPRGAIVCTARLVAYWQVGPSNEYGPTFVGFCGLTSYRQFEAPDLFGDYSVGRWIWALADVCRLDVPVPFLGRQGFFDVPDELLGVGR